MSRKNLSIVFQLPSLLFILISSVAGVGNLNIWSSEKQSSNSIRTSDVFFEIVEPHELEYTYKIVPANGFGVPFNSSFSERNIGLVPVEPPTGCHRLKNVDQVEGKVALITRGECSFIIKTMIAEEAGAKAAIISDYYPASLEESRDMPLWIDHYYIEMINDDSTPLTKPVNIPAGFLLGKNGLMIRKTLNRLKLPYALINIPVNLTYSLFGEFSQPPWISW